VPGAARSAYAARRAREPRPGPFAAPCLSLLLADMIWRATS